jgi:diacylglycerol kinase (ATP)
VEIGVIIRPREGMEGLEALRDQVAWLRSEGHEVAPRLTFEGGDAKRMARSLAGSGVALMIAAGGDGTINEVVNGLMEVESDTRLAVVPLGTANDFALGLGVPEGIPEAFRVAVEGVPRPIDVARVNERHFINVSTGGFGATATEETPSEAKRLLGPWAYVVTGVKKFTELRPSRVRFDSPEGERYRGEVMLFGVGNAKRTGGGTLLTPRAEFGDGELDVVIVPGMNRMDFMALLPDLRAGTHLDSPDVQYFRTSELEVESEDELSVNADGEPLTGTRFHYSLSERRLEVMAPSVEPAG